MYGFALERVTGSLVIFNYCHVSPSVNKELMLCYVMLFYVMLCYDMLCYFTEWNGVVSSLCCIMFRYVTFQFYD